MEGGGGGPRKRGNCAGCERCKTVLLPVATRMSNNGPGGNWGERGATPNEGVENKSRLASVKCGKPVGGKPKEVSKLDPPICWGRLRTRQRLGGPIHHEGLGGRPQRNTAEKEREDKREAKIFLGWELTTKNVNAKLDGMS